MAGAVDRGAIERDARRRRPSTSRCARRTPALIACAASARSFASMSPASAPWRQSPGRKSTAEAEALGQLAPQRREVAGLGHQHAIAGRERVDQRRFPRAGARRG
jgi:hypothetical protein